MILDTGCLTNEQINKVKFSLESKEKTKDKLKVMRALIKNGINNFNVDRLFLALRLMEEKQ